MPDCGSCIGVEAMIQDLVTDEIAWRLKGESKDIESFWNVHTSPDHIILQ